MGWLSIEWPPVTMQEEASLLPSDAGEVDVIPDSQDAYERQDTCFSSGKHACKSMQDHLTGGAGSCMAADMCPTAPGVAHDTTASSIREEEDFDQADEVANLQSGDACLAWTTW